MFVVDGVPENFVLRKIKLFLIRMLQGMLKSRPDYSRFPLFYKICLAGTRALGRLFPERVKQEWYEKVSRLWSGDDPAFVSVYNSLFRYIGVKFRGDIMKNLVMRKFEDAAFCVPARYDEFLTAQYGDWRTPPPEAERIPQHL